MTYVAITALAVAGVTAVASASLIRSLIRQQARERATLIDQICHLSGRTWTPAPATPEWEPPQPRETERNFDQYAEYEIAE